MKVYVFEGSYQLEVIAAESEEAAWAFLESHDGTAGRTTRSQWDIRDVFDVTTMATAACIAHYSG